MGSRDETDEGIPLEEVLYSVRGADLEACAETQEVADGLAFKGDSGGNLLQDMMGKKTKVY